MTWTRQSFLILTRLHRDQSLAHVSVDGMVRGMVGIHVRETSAIDVTHLPTGRRIATFTNLGACFEFASRASDLMSAREDVPAALRDELHRIATALEDGAHKPAIQP